MRGAKNKENNEKKKEHTIKNKPKIELEKNRVGTREEGTSDTALNI